MTRIPRISDASVILKSMLRKRLFFSSELAFENICATCGRGYSLLLSTHSMEFNPSRRRERAMGTMIKSSAIVVTAGMCTIGDGRHDLY